MQLFSNRLSNPLKHRLRHPLGHRLRTPRLLRPSRSMHRPQRRNTLMPHRQLQPRHRPRPFKPRSNRRAQP